MNQSNEVRVLVVEDEPIILRHVMRKVEKLGAPIRVVGGAESAAQATEMLVEYNPDVLLTDIEMAGKNGLELIEYAKQLMPNLRVIILSGYSSFEYAQAALRYGVDDYLLKPVGEASLQQVFDRVIELVFSTKQQIVDEEPIESGDEALVIRIKQYLDEQFNQPITMMDLSAYFSYAPSYLSRIFKKEYGVPPMHYQTKIRIKKAKKMLGQVPPLNIKEIAAAVGYEDARYFSRIFRQFEHVTPTEWQARKSE